MRSVRRVEARPRRAKAAVVPFVLLCSFPALLALVPGEALAGRGGIDDPSGSLTLQVSFRSQPTYQDVAEVQAALSRTAEILCDASEGQVRVSRVRLTSSPADEDASSLWLHDGDAASGGPWSARGGDLGRLGAHMDVFASARLRPDRLAHLLGHHAFGLGDQYDEQRRRGGACGIGPGFEASRLDERNHSIMQAAGGMRCLEGSLAGQECLRDDECGGAPCEPWLASEWSVDANHDLLRGDGGVCPRPSPVSRLRLVGLLPRSTAPVGRLDSRDFLSARATSAWHERVEVVDPRRENSSVGLELYLSHLEPLVWQLSVAADAGELGGTRGQLRLLGDWRLAFNEDFSLASVHPGSLRLDLPPVGGRPALEVAIDLGTRNPDAETDPGHGYDGFQMVAAGAVSVDVEVDGVVGCDASWCAESWNASTGRWELSEQTILHGGSDWQALARNFPFLTPLQEAPAAVAPAACRTPPEFLTDVMGADQVVLVMDTSRSTGARVDGREGEVCANGVDDDDDGSADEADCADSVLEFERAAVRAFLALAGERDLQVGLVSMHTDAEPVSDVEQMGGARRAALGALLASVQAEGGTAMGTALEVAQESLAKVRRVGRSRTVILMSDGARNVGVEPLEAARVLEPEAWRVFPVAVGGAADRKTLAALAARGGGVAYSTPRASHLPAILAELAARHGGHALLLPRTTFDLARQGEGAKVASSKEFDLPVEERASELVLFVASAGSRIDDHRLFFELEAPDGGRIDDTSPQARRERGFTVVRVADPRPGPWRLRVLPAARGTLRSDILAYTVHPHAELVADADPRLASQSGPVRIGARVAYGSDLDGDVTMEGVVRRPDGSEVPVALARHPVTRAWSADFSRFAGRGHYEVRLHAKVGEGASTAEGERIFPGPSRSPLRVVPFERWATASFYVADGPPPGCPDNDCDDDGLSNRVEAACGEDVDGDGIPNRFDADADNDEILDGLEGTGDLDRDGVPDFCDPESAPTSMQGAIEAERAAVETACGGEASVSVAGLRSSLSAVRRILQEVRTQGNLPLETRQHLVARLEKVIELKKQAVVIGDVLPEFCGKYRSRLEEALAIEDEIRAEVDALLAP